MDFLLSTLFRVDDTRHPMPHNPNNASRYNRDDEPAAYGFFFEPSDAANTSPCLRRNSLRRGSLSIDMRNYSTAYGGLEPSKPSEPDVDGGRRAAAGSEEQWRCSCDTCTDSEPVVFANPHSGDDNGGSTQVTWRCQLCGEHGDQVGKHTHAHTLTRQPAYPATLPT